MTDNDVAWLAGYQAAREYTTNREGRWRTARRYTMILTACIGAAIMNVLWMIVRVTGIQWQWVGTALSGAIIATCVVVSILSRRNFKVMDRELDLDTQVWTQHLEGLR